MIMTSERPARRRAMRKSGELELRRETKRAFWRRVEAERKHPPFRFTETRSQRQSRRELAGFYEGTMSLAHVLHQRHGRFGRQKDDETGLLVRMR